MYYTVKNDDPIIGGKRCRQLRINVGHSLKIFEFTYIKRVPSNHIFCGIIQFPERRMGLLPFRQFGR